MRLPGGSTLEAAPLRGTSAAAPQTLAEATKDSLGEAAALRLPGDSTTEKGGGSLRPRRALGLGGAPRANAPAWGPAAEKPQQLAEARGDEDEEPAAEGGQEEDGEQAEDGEDGAARRLEPKTEHDAADGEQEKKADREQTRGRPPPRPPTPREQEHKEEKELEGKNLATNGDGGGRNSEEAAASGWNAERATDLRSTKVQPRVKLTH